MSNESRIAELDAELYELTGCNISMQNDRIESLEAEVTRLSIEVAAWRNEFAEELGASPIAPCSVRYTSLPLSKIQSAAAKRTIPK